jgi:hypothetical protein
MKSIQAVAAGVVFFACTASAAPIFFAATLNNAGEGSNSPGTGNALVTIDPVLNTMRVQVTFTGLLGTTTASHIHAPTPAPLTGNAGVATTTPTFPGFPLGVTAGTYDQTFDMTQTSSYNPSFITGNGGTSASAEAALFADINALESYLNIHTNLFPGGEIRGFLVGPVPEPTTFALGGAALLALAGLRRIRRAR